MAACAEVSPPRAQWHRRGPAVQLGLTRAGVFLPGRCFWGGRQMCRDTFSLVDWDECFPVYVIAVDRTRPVGYELRSSFSASHCHIEAPVAHSGCIHTCHWLKVEWEMMSSLESVTGRQHFITCVPLFYTFYSKNYQIWSFLELSDLNSIWNYFDYMNTPRFLPNTC